MADKYYYSYEEFLKDHKRLTHMVKPFNPDTIIAITRGGLVPALFLSEALNIKEFHVVNATFYDDDNNLLKKVEVSNLPNMIRGSRALVVDEIVDTGETAHAILNELSDKNPDTEFKLATYFYKKNSIYNADFKLNVADKWINFFWEVDSNP